MKKIRGQAVYPVKERLKRNSVLNLRTGCIEWIGSLRNGYGRLIVGSRIDGSRRSESAHRASYKAYKGDIPDGLFVCHKCDNPKCINPDHLFLGTRQDNVDDREAKGRNKTGNTYGESHPKSKLNWAAVDSIRKLSDQHTQSELATIYGVSREAIKDVIAKKTWTRRPQPPHKQEG